jgi:hypothetical protein
VMSLSKSCVRRETRRLWKRDQAPGEPGASALAVRRAETLSITDSDNSRTTRNLVGTMRDDKKKLTLSKETLRTLDEKELSRVVGGDASGGNKPKCPNTKENSCDCGKTNGAVCHP